MAFMQGGAAPNPQDGQYRAPAKMTIKALQSRLKAAQEAAAQATQIQTPLTSPTAGIAHVLGAAVAGYGRGQAENAEASARDQLARAMTRIDEKTGLPTQEAVGEITGLDPEMGQRLVEKLADLRRSDQEYQRTRADKLADRGVEWGHEAEIDKRELGQEGVINDRERAEAEAVARASREEAERIRLAQQEGDALRIVSGPEAQKLGGDPNRSYRLSADNTTLEDITPEVPERWVDIPTPPGETGQWQQSSTTSERKRIGSSPSIVNNVGGNTNKLLDKLSEKEGENWAKIQTTANAAAGNRGDFETIGELIKIAPQGPVPGFIAERFGNFSNAGAAFKSIVKRIAPTLRVEGSGSTSDIEYQGLLDSLPSLSNYPEANQMILEVMKQKADLNIAMGQVVNDVQNGAITPEAGRARMTALQQKSLTMPPALRALIDKEKQAAMGGGDFSDADLDAEIERRRAAGGQ